MQEVWKPVVGYEGLYEVSNLGRVKSLNRIDSSGKRRNGRILKLNFDGKYYSVMLSRESNTYRIRVHLLMAISFFNHKPSRDFHVDHIDRNKTNNNINNLRVITCRDNISNTDKREIKGYYHCKVTNKYRVQVEKKGVIHYLGLFKTIEEAKNAYISKVKELDGNQ